jgi:hypothetical protein
MTKMIKLMTINDKMADALCTMFPMPLFQQYISFVTVLLVNKRDGSIRPYALTEA